MRTKKGQVAIERIPFSSRNLKGQVAIEYLTTYGWAILLLIIVMGILVSTFSPSVLVSEQCNVDKSNLPCTAQVYNEGDDLVVAFRVTNAFGYEIKVQDVEVTNKDGDLASALIKYDYIDVSSAQPGENVTVYATFTDDNKPANTLITFTVKLTYQSCAHEINPGCENENAGIHVKTGKIVARVTE